MNTFISTLPAWLIFTAFIFLVVNMVMWFFLPFAVFGIKKRLDSLIGLKQDEIDCLNRVRSRVENQTEVIKERNNNILI